MSAYKKLENRNEYYTYSYKKIHHKININDIMYFESNNRKICIHTNGNQENNTFYGQLDKVEKDWNPSHVHSFGFISLIW